MTRRKTVAVVAVAAMGLLVGAGATAWAFHGGGGRPALMRRVATAMVDDALDAAQVTPEQRATIHAARDRVLAAIEESRQARMARRETMFQLFQADQVDEGQLQALRAQTQNEHRRIGDALVQALRETHDTLTAAQRTALADYVRAHRPHGWQ
jgi:Spy/CpxP family protein refolding chaperone